MTTRADAHMNNGRSFDRMTPPDFLTVEAGGAAYDIDGDGDLDIVFGGDYQSNELWWWENPYPHFDSDIPWKRHIIKKGGANQHHDQIFADFKGTGKPQLAFWNQGAKTLYLAEIPANPRSDAPWPLETIFSGNAGEETNNAAKYAEGIDAFDVDGDGRVDLLAGNSWFKYDGNGKFRAIPVGTIGGRIRAGHFKPGKYAQIVIAPGDQTTNAYALFTALTKWNLAVDRIVGGHGSQCAASFAAFSSPSVGATATLVALVTGGTFVF